MLNKEDLISQFNDFEELTEFYYNELGKLEFVKDSLKRKEYKSMRSIIVKMLFLRAEVFLKEEKASVKVDKVDINEFKESFINEHKKKEASFFQRFKNIFKRSKVEVIEGVSEMQRISSSQASQNVNTKSDNEVMTF